jgi:CDP-glucose 4,6-dehydratase
LTIGARLIEDGQLNGQSYNFGPLAEVNRSVVELIADLATAWGDGADDTLFHVTDDIPFHEAGLLKLNCDKALLDLKWTPTLSYRECVEFTGDWYRRVLREGDSPYAVTAEQIRSYECRAAERGRVWATS